MLAIDGFKKTCNDLFPRQYNKSGNISFDVQEFIKNKIYSKYRGNWTDNFWGGEYVKELENFFELEWSTYVDEAYALAVNSCTSALIIACGVAGIEPGDEVIVTPWSMTCSATAPMFYGGIPVFADIEKDYFCLDAKDIEKKITKKTRAIIVVDLFGQPYDVTKINNIAKKHNLIVIEDAAQAIGASFDNKKAGILGDIGCFSFTQGKHYTCGEGGIMLFKDKNLYLKAALIRNHAEAVINDMYNSSPGFYNKNVRGMNNLVGFNARMTDIQALLLLEQLYDNPPEAEVRRRENNINSIMSREINNYLELYPTRKKANHAYYVMPLKYKLKHKAIDDFVSALKKELNYETDRIDRGIPINYGYIRPIYQMPLFQENQHWAIKDINYKSVKCEMAEYYSENELIISLYHSLQLQPGDISNIQRSIMKVIEKEYR